MRTRRVFISLPADHWLTDAENKLKWAVVRRVEQLGYVAEIFLDPRGTQSISANKSWSARGCEDVMRKCDGCVVLGFPRWRLDVDDREYRLATEFNHYEGAVAHTLGLPILTLLQDGVERRVVFDGSFGGFVCTIPLGASPAWLRTKDFTAPFGYWQKELETRRDLFLGYCSSSSALAKRIKNHLESGLGLRVLDWATDFDPAQSILSQIEEASRRCGAGVFLFTKDDFIDTKNSKSRFVPRDNVVFEAGHFCASKGKERVLIALESGAKMPADLGGDIYLSLPPNGQIDKAKPVLQKFARSL